MTSIELLWTTLLIITLVVVDKSVFLVLMPLLCSWMTDEQLATITPSLLDGRPNTYTFTKSLAENVLANEGQGLPIAVFRPSIVGGAYQEPYPGWIDVIHGASGIFVAVSDNVHSCELLVI